MINMPTSMSQKQKTGSWDICGDGHNTIDFSFYIM
jgi:hypothetical protein